MEKQSKVNGWLLKVTMLLLTAVGVIGWAGLQKTNQNGEQLATAIAKIDSLEKKIDANAILAKSADDAELAETQRLNDRLLAVEKVQAKVTEKLDMR